MHGSNHIKKFDKIYLILTISFLGVIDLTNEFDRKQEECEQLDKAFIKFQSMKDARAVHRVFNKGKGKYPKGWRVSYAPTPGKYVNNFSKHICNAGVRAHIIYSYTDTH